MKNPFRIPRLDTEEKFILTGKVIAIGCIVVAALGIAVPLALGEPSLALLGSYLAIPMLIVPPIFFLLKSAGGGVSPPVSLLSFRALVVGFTLLFTASLISLYFSDVRQPVYYLLVTLMGVCILLEILGGGISPGRVQMILAQMAFLFLNLDWGVTLKYHFFIGRTDPLGHSWLIESLLQHGHITGTFGEYQEFPLWHILCSMAYGLAGIFETARQVMFLLNGLVYVGVIVFVFLIARKIIQDEKFALVTALFAVFNPGVIAYGMTSIPRSAVLLLMLALIWLLLDMRTAIHVVLVVLLCLSTILYHTVSMPFIVLILLVIYLLQLVYRERVDQGFLSLPFLVLMAIMTLVYWMFFAAYLFRIVVFNILMSAPEKLSLGSVMEFPLTELFNYLQYLPLLFFLILGVLYAMESRRCSFPFRIFCLTGLLMVPAVFPGPALLIGKLAANFNIARFEEYAFLFLSLAAAAGFLFLYRRSRRTGKVVVILLFAVMCMLSVSNDFVASDSPLVKRPFYTFSLSKPEVTGFDHLAAVRGGALILSDYVTGRYYQYSPYRENSTVLQVKPSTQAFLENESTDLILIRREELARRPLKVIRSRTGIFLMNPDFSALDFYYRQDPVWDQLDRAQRFYDSGWVEGYR